MKKGFTIVELLAAIAIMALIIIISVPAYEGISKTIKENNFKSKISMIEKATLAYVNKYHKDKVFNGSNTPTCYTINYLINKNIFSPDNDTDNGITDPVNGGNLTGYLKAEYSVSTYKVTIKYIDEDLNSSTDCTGGKFGIWKKY